MNEFSDFEHELKALRPARPSNRLLENVARQLQESSAGTAGPEEKIIRPFQFRLGGFSLGAALAAAAAIFILARLEPFTVETHRSRTAKAAPAAAALPASAEYIPAGATRVVYHTQDDGLIFPQGADAPVRRVRSRSRETLQWRNQETGASLRVTYPSEEVRFIPVSGQ